MLRTHTVIKDAALTAGILSVSFAALSLAQYWLDVQSVTPIAPIISFFAVFLIALFTRGYACGIIAAFVCMFEVNYAFTFPYFAFNFSMPVNLFSAAVMLCVSIITSTLTTQIKRQQRIKSEIETEKMRANLLRTCPIW